MVMMVASIRFFGSFLVKIIGDGHGFRVLFVKGRSIDHPPIFDGKSPAVYGGELMVVY